MRFYLLHIDKYTCFTIFLSILFTLLSFPTYLWTYIVLQYIKTSRCSVGIFEFQNMFIRIYTWLPFRLHYDFYLCMLQMPVNIRPKCDFGLSLPEKSLDFTVQSIVWLRPKKLGFWWTSKLKVPSFFFLQFEFRR